MSICDRCIHDEVCGLEGNHEEAIAFCSEIMPKTGHWIFDEILDKHYYCSECKSMGVDYWDFCPYCGAKMVEPQEGDGEE